MKTAVSSSRIDSLPDDLRAIAKDMLSEKFPIKLPTYEDIEGYFELIDPKDVLIHPIIKSPIIQKPRNYGRSEYIKQIQNIVSDRMNYEMNPLMYIGVDLGIADE